MKRIFTYTLLCIAFCTVHAQDFFLKLNDPNYSFAEIQQEAEAYFAVHETGPGSGYKQYKRWEYDQICLNGLDEARAQKQWKRNHPNYLTRNTRAESVWEEQGPRIADPLPHAPRVGNGRIQSVAVDPADHNRLFVASPRGGVWRTLDGGQTWLSLTDHLPYLRAHSVTIDPHNADKIYMGTVGAFYYSLNRGDSWNESNMNGSAPRVDRVIVDPTNPNIVLAATTSGVYRSTDGGLSFSRMIYGFYEDIEFHPSNPLIVYASRTSVIRSTDGGITWATITGIPTLNRAKIAVSPAAPDRVYILKSDYANFENLYISDDAGATFRTQPISANENQTWHNMALAVSPTDANQVHIAGINSWRSNDAGLTWYITSSTSVTSSLGYHHADVMTFEYLNNNELFVGTDGGVYKSSDNGGTWVDLSKGLGIRMFYRIGITEQDPDLISGGSQDNGTCMTTGSTYNDWVNWTWGDGMETFFDYTNKDVIYATSQYGYLKRSTDGGYSVRGISAPGGSSAWVTPFEIDPLVNTTLYVGKKKLYKSTNRGDSWSELYDPGVSNNITRLEIAPSDPNYIYFSNGQTDLYGTNDGGTSWYRLNNPSTNMFTVDPNNPSHLVAINGRQMHESTDAGLTWNNTAKDLPIGESAQSIKWTKGANQVIYVGSATGVFYTTNQQSDWTEYSAGLPKVWVRDIEINYTTAEIYVGTYGRGAWKAPLVHFVAPPIANFNIAGNKDTTCANTNVYLANTSVGDISSYLWDLGPCAIPATSTNLYPGPVQFSCGGEHVITLTVTGPGGTSSHQDTIVVDEGCEGYAAIRVKGDLCAGQPIQIAAELVHPDYFMYSWDFSPIGTPIASGSRSTTVTYPEAGEYTITLVRTTRYGSEGSTRNIIIEDCNQQTAFKDHYFPGTVEAEDYDLGGEGIAYHDNTPSNEGGAYRQDAVDLEASTENSYNLGWTQAGEWTEYTVNVLETAEYELDLRVASLTENTRFAVFIDDILWGTVHVPNTGWWQNWATVTLPAFPLTQGQSVVKINCLTSDFNVNYMTARKIVEQRPYGGTAYAIPSDIIEAENFDAGGEGIAYHDSDAINEGSQYRNEGVDIEAFTYGQFNIGYIASGEWLEYSVIIDQGIENQTYQLITRVASEQWGGVFYLELDDQRICDNITAPSTGAWYNWTDVETPIYGLSAGEHILKVVMLSGPFNLESFYFEEVVADCEFTALNDDYDVQLNDATDGVWVTFEPILNYGEEFIILHYMINAGGQQNIMMTSNPFFIAGANSGSVLQLGFTYSVGSGYQRSTLDNEPMHHYTVGNCGGSTNAAFLSAPSAFTTTSLVLAPNPTENTLWIKAPENIHRIIVTNASGNEVFGQRTSGSHDYYHIDDLSFLPSGSYMIQVISADHVFSERFIKL